MQSDTLTLRKRLAEAPDSVSELPFNLGHNDLAKFLHGAIKVLSLVQIDRTYPSTHLIKEIDSSPTVRDCPG
jgi:hypothetical protein